ncbi:MAG: hypothetical protein CMM84_03870 [Rhodothermaceae bacterium]|nr:hypothetical protein [Rhodothermaceae bacterium]
MAPDFKPPVLLEVSAERARQDTKFPPPPRPDHSVTDWLAILTEEVGEAAQEAVEIRWASDAGEASRRTQLLRAELIQVAAVAVAWVEHIDGMAT